MTNVEARFREITELNIKAMKERVAEMEASIRSLEEMLKQPPYKSNISKGKENEPRTS